MAIIINNCMTLTDCFEMLVFKSSIAVCYAELILMVGGYFAVTSVRSPRQVIDALNAEGPDIDIILSEVDLPMSKGLKMLKYIMRDKELRRIPVISKLCIFIFYCHFPLGILFRVGIIFTSFVFFCFTK